MDGYAAAAEGSLVAQHVEEYHSGTVRVEAIEGKGRVLVAACDFEPGERILLEYPLVEVAVEEAAPAYRELLRLRDAGSLEVAPLFHWMALCSLTAADAAGASCAAWPTVPAQTQNHILQLHAPQEACEGPSPGTAAVAAALWPSGEGPEALLLERLLQVWTHNSFDQGGTDDSLEAGALYFAAAMLSHSCSPSAAWHLDESNTYILHARCDIEEGEEITIPYLSLAELCLPTPDRCEILLASKGFSCRCERCVLPLDSARSFACPRCAGANLAMASVVGDPCTLECSGCGPLEPAEAAPLLAFEASLRAWARPESEVEPESLREAGAPGRTALDCLREAKAGGLADTHWIVDIARCRAGEEDPSLLLDLLRKRLAAYAAAGGHAVTGCARLRVEMGRAIISRCGSDAQALQEAVEACAAAADTLALLFGDDHPEHQEAAAVLAKAQRLARTASRSGGGSGAAGEAAGDATEARDGRRKAGKKGRR